MTVTPDRLRTAVLAMQAHAAEAKFLLLAARLRRAQKYNPDWPSDR